MFDIVPLQAEHMGLVHTRFIFSHPTFIFFALSITANIDQMDSAMQSQASSQNMSFEGMAEHLAAPAFNDPFEAYSASSPSTQPPPFIPPLCDRPLPPPPPSVLADKELSETWAFVNELLHELDDATPFQVPLKKKIRRRIAGPLLVGLHFLMLAAARRIEQAQGERTRDLDMEFVAQQCWARYRLVSIPCN